MLVWILNTTPKLSDVVGKGHPVTCHVWHRGE